MIQASWKPFTVSTPNRTPLVWISTLQFAQITVRLLACLITTLGRHRYWFTSSLNGCRFWMFVHTSQLHFLYIPTADWILVLRLFTIKKMWASYRRLSNTLSTHDFVVIPSNPFTVDELLLDGYHTWDLILLWTQLSGKYKPLVTALWVPTRPCLDASLTSYSAQALRDISPAQYSFGKISSKRPCTP
jgi:hypothetical protein